MEIWKTVIAPMIVGILMLVIGLWVGRTQAPELPAVTAEIRYVDFNNPIVSMEIKDRRPLLEQIGIIWGTKELSGGPLAFLGFETKRRLVNLTITNNGRVRSKQVEVLADAKTLLFAENAKDGNRAAISKILLNPLDPGASTRVLVLTDSWYTTPIINVLHEDKLVPMAEIAVNPGSEWIIGFINERPLLSLLLGWFGVCALAILSISLPIGLVREFSPEFKTRTTSNADVAKMVRFIEYLKINHPERLPPNVSNAG